MEFKHPNYYKKLRKQYRDSQVVHQVKLSSQSQAASDKPKPEPSSGSETVSHKLQAPSCKRQA